VARTHNTVSEKQNFRSLIDDLNLADEVAALHVAATWKKDEIL
jgi:hypothetical protein